MQHSIGVIDLGSNTTRLIVMAYNRPSCYRLMDEVRESVRLIDGMGDDRALQPAAMERAIDSLAMFKALCQGAGVAHVIAVGTSAVRDASNQTAFLARVKDETGLDVRVLSGEEEAYYGYLGVVNSTAVQHGFVLDIGGGSTEVTHIANRQFGAWVSRPVGAVRFTQRYIHTDPISTKDYHALEQGADEQFTDLDWFAATPNTRLVGIGGTIRNLARVAQKRSKYPLERLHGYILHRDMLRRIITTLRNKNQTERETIAGLNSERADVILAGAMVLYRAMLHSGYTEIEVCGQGLREGIFYEQFLNDRSPPIIDNVRQFSVYNLVQQFHYEPAHVEKVRELSISIFDQTTALHGYGAWERELLGAAAILHDIGVTVSYYDHHKHSAYLLQHSGLPGFSPREIALLTVLVRSHRKGDVLTREFDTMLQPDDATRLARLAAMLRLAEFLERSKSQAIDHVQIELTNGTMRIHVYASGDVTAEIWNATRRSRLFQKAFGLQIDITPAVPTT